MVNSISILGCTGSIGRQTIAVAEHIGMRVAALTANRKIELLEEQARRLKPEFVAVYDEDAAKQFRIAVADTDIRVGSGMAGLIEAATLASSDCVVTAVSGAVGLKPTLAAIDEKKRIALANKETLVCAGSIVMRRAAERPIGYVGSAVMLNAKLKPKVNLMHVVALTRSLGERLSEEGQEPEIYRWTDGTDSHVTCEFVNGRLVKWTLVRPQKSETQAPQSPTMAS